MSSVLRPVVLFISCFFFFPFVCAEGLCTCRVCILLIESCNTRPSHCFLLTRLQGNKHRVISKTTLWLPVPSLIVSCRGISIICMNECTPRESGAHAWSHKGADEVFSGCRRCSAFNGALAFLFNGLTFAKEKHPRFELAHSCPHKRGFVPCFSLGFDQHWSY